MQLRFIAPRSLAHSLRRLTTARGQNSSKADGAAIRQSKQTLARKHLFIRSEQRLRQNGKDMYTVRFLELLFSFANSTAGKVDVVN